MKLFLFAFTLLLLKAANNVSLLTLQFILLVYRSLKVNNFFLL